MAGGEAAHAGPEGCAIGPGLRELRKAEVADPGAAGHRRDHAFAGHRVGLGRRDRDPRKVRQGAEKVDNFDQRPRPPADRACEPGSPDDERDAHAILLRGNARKARLGRVSDVSDGSFR